MPKAVSMAEALLKEYKNKLSAVTLIPSDGGRYEVSVNDKLVFSKLELGRFPEVEEIKAHLG
ncbi:MAG: Rdx family protein [Abditibacteriales bacterium]|nr:Rdx family protein [Abditibacteriales bacterium]